MEQGPYLIAAVPGSGRTVWSPGKLAKPKVTAHHSWSSYRTVRLSQIDVIDTGYW